MCTNCTVSLDQTKTDAFAEKMVGVLNQSAIGIMTSIGHRTGLFDAMADLEPSTSEQIADKAKLNERYVREWLGTMVTGQIIEYNSEDKTYRLPEEHAAWLTRKNAPNNIAVTKATATLRLINQNSPNTRMQLRRCIIRFVAW